jgi:hypothetical protein
MTKAQKVAHNEKRRNHYKQLAADRRDESLSRSFKAGDKRQWIMGVSVPSKRDIMSALRSDLININQQCVGEGLNPIFMDEEEEPVVQPTPID